MSAWQTILRVKQTVTIGYFKFYKKINLKKSVSTHEEKS